LYMRVTTGTASAQRLSTAPALSMEEPSAVSCVRGFHMGWFSKQSVESPERAKWPYITQAIAEAFEGNRQKWFELCAHELNAAGFVKRGPKAKADLGDDIVVVLKAYQLGGTAGFLQKRDYLSSLTDEQTREFADLLWAHVCGPSLPTVSHYVTKLGAVPDAQRHLAARVVEYITDAPGVLEMICLSGPVRVFEVANCMAIASAFRDNKTLDALKVQRDLLKEASACLAASLNRASEMSARELAGGAAK
jgi:hypothetical protein